MRRIPQSEITFAGEAFALVIERAIDGDRVRDEAARRVQDQQESERGQLDFLASGQDVENNKPPGARV